MSEINPFFRPRLITNFKPLETSETKNSADCLYNVIDEIVSVNLPEKIRRSILEKSGEKFETHYWQISFANVVLFVATRLDMLGKDYYFYTDLPKLSEDEIDYYPIEALSEMGHIPFRSSDRGGCMEMFTVQDMIYNYALQCAVYMKCGRTDLEVAFLRILNEYTLRLLKNYDTTQEKLSDIYRDLDVACTESGLYKKEETEIDVYKLGGVVIDKKYFV